jgi:D-alanyl-D-alanine carboxypeptidase (penicillin-binding protein 5/6)
MQLMNAYAAELKLENSSFLNPHGMCNNSSSAIDIAKICTECFKIPLFLKIVATQKHTIKIRYISEKGDCIGKPILL